MKKLALLLMFGWIVWTQISLEGLPFTYQKEYQHAVINKYKYGYEVDKWSPAEGLLRLVKNGKNFWTSLNNVIEIQKVD